MRGHGDRDGEPASTTARSGACSRTSSAPPPRTSFERDAAGGADRGPRRGGGRRGVLPLPPVPRRRGRHPHPADRDRRRRAAGAADRPRDRRRARARRDLPLRLSGPRSDAPGVTSVDPGRGRLLGDRAGQRLHPPHARRRRRSPPPASATSSRSPTRRCRSKSRSSDRNQINKNRRSGYELRLVPGPETSAAERAGFLAAYEQTMRRTDAAERYFFGAAYFDRILESRAHLARPRRSPRGRVAAASIAARSDGFLHYYLSGSADSHLRDSPMKNVVAALVELAAEPACRSTSAAASHAATASRSSSEASPTASSPGAPRRSSATPAAYDRLSAPARRGRATSSPPTGRPR